MTYNPQHDYNSAETGGGSFDLIPADTVAKVSMTVRPGNVSEGGWLTQSKSSDAQYLNCEFVVIEGPFAKRKFWGNLTVSGGKVNEKGESIAGNITRATLRAILESSRNVKPDDESDEAKRKRLVDGYQTFNGMTFWAKIGVEPARGEYKAKNYLAAVVTPDKPGYAGAPAPTEAASVATATPSWANSASAEPQAAPNTPSGSAPAWARG